MVTMDLMDILAVVKDLLQGTEKAKRYMHTINNYS